MLFVSHETYPQTQLHTKDNMPSPTVLQMVSCLKENKRVQWCALFLQKPFHSTQLHTKETMHANTQEMQNLRLFPTSPRYETSHLQSHRSLFHKKTVEAVGKPCDGNHKQLQVRKNVIDRTRQGGRGNNFHLQMQKTNFFHFKWQVKPVHLRK